MPLASWRDCIYLFFKPAVRWRPPYLDLIAYPAIYPFWLIPVQLETSRHHIFSYPSRAISAISKPKSVEENGCRACDVHNPCRHLHEVRGRSWLRMVQEVAVPPRHIRCSWCPGLSHWIRTPVGRLEAQDEFNFISWPNRDGQ